MIVGIDLKKIIFWKKITILVIGHSIELLIVFSFESDKEPDQTENEIIRMTLTNITEHSTAQLRSDANEEHMKWTAL